MNGDAFDCEVCNELGVGRPATCTVHLADSDSAANIAFVCREHAGTIVEGLIADGESVDVMAL